MRSLLVLALLTCLSTACASPRAPEPLPGDWLGGITLESPWRALAPAELRALLASAHERAQALVDYAAVLETRERIDDALFPRRVMSVKIRRAPFSVAIETHEPSSERGQRVWYDQSKNDGKLLAETPGLLGALVGLLALDPQGDLARKDRRHPITDIGLVRLLEQLEDALEPPREPAPELRAADARIDERPALLVEAIVIESGDTSDGHTTDAGQRTLYRIGIDHESALVTYFGNEELLADGPHLIEEYLYRDLRANLGLTDADFRPAK